MKDKTSDRIALVSILICILSAGAFIGYQKEKIDTLESQSKIEVLEGGDIEKANLIDSLHDELFIIKVENGRYELTFEHLKEVNPKLGKEMEDWMAHETE
jgi:hypothetical protein